MDIQTRKIEFVQAFLQIQNETIISRFEELLKSEQEEIIPISIERFNDRINQSMNDSVNGRLTEAGQLLEEIKEWK